MTGGWLCYDLVTTFKYYVDSFIIAFRTRNVECLLLSRSSKTTHRMYHQPKVPFFSCVSVFRLPID